MKGGPRANAGRPLEPDAIRRDRPSDQAGWVTLPASRDGAVPEWPLSDASQRELQLWAAEWKRPQAVMWEANGQAIEVAMYVRTLKAAEKDDASTATRTLLKQQQEALGLSLPGLARLRWRIAGATDTQQESKRADGNRRTSAKDRFAVIEGRRTA